MKVMIVAYCSLLLLSSTASADDNDRVIYGKGGDSCGSFLQAMNDDSPNMMLIHKGKKFAPPSALYGTWIMGWVSAANVLALNAQTQVTTDYLDVMMSVKKRCEEHPERDVSWAINDFILLQMKGR